MFGGFVPGNQNTIISTINEKYTGKVPLRVGTVYVMEQCSALSLSAIRKDQEKYTFQNNNLRQYLFVVGPLKCNSSRMVVLIVTLVPSMCNSGNGIYYDFAIHNNHACTLTSDRFQIPVLSLSDRLCYDSSVPVSKCREGYFTTSSSSLHQGANLMHCPNAEALQWFDNALAHFLAMDGFNDNFVDLTHLQNNGFLFNPSCPALPFKLPISSNYIITYFNRPIFPSMPPPPIHATNNTPSCYAPPNMPYAQNHPHAPFSAHESGECSPPTSPSTTLRHAVNE
jgi:hypothetical protein